MSTWNFNRKIVFSLAYFANQFLLDCCYVFFRIKNMGQDMWDCTLTPYIEMGY